MKSMGQVQCAGCRQPYDEGSRFCPYCGTAAAAAALALADPFVGAVVNGKFRVEALIGQGGMGRVYRARHLTLDRQVVLKMLHRAYSGDPQIVQRFQREARAASRLNHQNSIAVLDFGENEDGTLFMAMEYLAGRDLGRVVAEDFPLGEPRIVRIGAQVLSALAEAHAQGVIHRDLKPENVMVEPRRDNPDFVKVLDFGIAKIVSAGDSEPRLTQAGLVCGTPEYMSPEQARGADLDARSDLYSMGVLLYQLCTGALPFQSDTPVGFLTAHLSQIPVPPRQRRPDLAISTGLDALISRALEKDPARRFDSADEMRAALVACAPSSGARLAAAPDPRAAGLARWRGRGRHPAQRAQAVLDLRGRDGGRVAGRRHDRGHGVAHLGRAAELRPRPGSGTADVDGGAGARHHRSVAGSRHRDLAHDPHHADPARSRHGGDPVAGDERSDHGRGRGDRSGPGAEGIQPAPPVSSGRPRPGARSRTSMPPSRSTWRPSRRIPALAEAQKKLALCYQLKGDRRRATERYRRYLATNPPDADRVRAILGTLE